MKRIAFSWAAVAASLRERAMQQQQFADDAGEAAAHLNPGQRASLHALADRIGEHGVVLADEVGMGKTRIAVELIRAVKDAGGRAAVIAPIVSPRRRSGTTRIDSTRRRRSPSRCCSSCAIS